MTTDGLEGLRDKAARWEEGIRADSPIYSQIARRIVEDDALLELVDAAPPGQPGMNLLLAAVQYLLMEDPTQPLAAWYPSLGGTGTGSGLPDEFAAYVAARRDTIVDLIQTRRVQTNEVGRCSFLVPAYNLVAASSGRPLAVIEIGTSAGLTQNLDKYGYLYLARDEAVALAPAAPVQLSCTTGDRVPSPARSLPPVAWRTGIEQRPVDITDGDQARWMCALIWPDDVARHERFLAAVELARHHPPSVVAGNALTMLPAVVATAPPDTAVVVQHSWVLNQVARADRERLMADLDELGAARPIFRVGAEALDRSPVTILEVTRHGPTRESRRLAAVHHHGAWIDWYAEPG